MAHRLVGPLRQTSLLLLCDMQEKFRSTIKYFPQIVETSNKLLQACKILEVPYLVTEQYPKGNRYEENKRNQSICLCFKKVLVER